VLHHVGAGGLGDVYSAFDTELERKVAIKLLRTDTTGGAHELLGDRRARVLREAQAIAQIRHPNVVVVHDVGEYGDGMFLAMELLEGRTVDAWIRGERRDWRRIRDVFVDAGAGLAAAHRAGLIHRDFKPGNVMLADDGRVTVLDFGLARASTTAPDGVDDIAEVSLGERPTLLSSDLTDANLVLGTPPYMAPELGTGADASPRTDQFAFCVALFRCLYRELPFAADTVRAYRAAAQTGAIVTPRDRHGVPAWLDRALVRGLAADPNHRFGTMDALLEALQHDRRRARRALVAGMIAIPVASIVAIAASLWWRPAPSPEQLDVARALADEARMAAAHGHYVYPPPDRPAEPTAIGKILELEATEGAIADRADQTAAELRDEMADALVALGDRYFERPGGPPFAVDFYAAALVFDPSREQARERVTLTPGQLADLVIKAEHGGFSEAELVAAEPLAVLADADPSRQAQRLERYFGERPTSASTTRARLDGLVDRPRSSATIRSDAPQPTRVDAMPTTTPTPAVPPVVPDAAPRVVPPAPDPVRPAPTGTATHDPDAADALANAGAVALKGGRLDEAAKAFHRALTHDRGNVEALAGLAELHFERSEYRQAERFAALATARSGKSGALWILLGDARVKLLRYDDARVAYEEARTLGAASASTRIERLDRLVGP
jgi:tetratricopeptide (TPR) repeat protein